MDAVVKDVLPYLLGSSGCLVLALLFLWAFYIGKIHSDAEFRKSEARADALEAALEKERKAVDDLARTGGTTNQLIAALTQMATTRSGGSSP